MCSKDSLDYGPFESESEGEKAKADLSLLRVRLVGERMLWDIKSHGTKIVRLESENMTSQLMV
jgi:hypothetical protein